jgi:hypothetical protein
MNQTSNSMGKSALSTSVENKTRQLETIAGMLVIFCDCEGNSHQEFVPPDQKVKPALLTPGTVRRQN